MHLTHDQELGLSCRNFGWNVSINSKKLVNDLRFSRGQIVPKLGLQ